MKFANLLLFIVLTLPTVFNFNYSNVSVSRSGRIIGGKTVAAGQFPFMAAIYKSTGDGNYFCAGTLLNNQWVVTCAQCVDGALLFSIRIGLLKLSSDEGERLTTDTYFVHPDYDRVTLENDIGLIRFRLPITSTMYMQPVNHLADYELLSGMNVMAMGWGQISDTETGLSDDLHYVDVVAMSNDECRLTFGSQIKDNMVCITGNYNEGTCNGDLGSPLIQYGSRAITILVGISSFISSNGCEATDPSGFTRLTPYRDWIRNVTENN